MAKLKANRVKRALVVDDSAFMRKLISDYLNSHPDIEVIGIARNGRDAIEKVKTLKPDVVTLDVEMPVMDGLEALQEIMANHPVPVVMLSSTTKQGTENTMLAMAYGAVDFVAKPGGAISLNLHEIKEEIIEKVTAACGVQISRLTRMTPEIRKSVGKRNILVEQNSRMIKENPSEVGNHVRKRPRRKFANQSQTFVLIGTSTGGPRALQEVLTQLPSHLQAPIIIVQHMPPGFTKSLADRLDGLSEIKVKEARNGELLENGTAYIAPGGHHLKIKKLGTSYYANVDDLEPPRLGHRPAVDVLLESAAEIVGVNFLTVIMTGMGSDGRAGIERLKETANSIVFAESSETTVVYGMPRAIIDAGLADEVIKVQDVSNAIIDVLKP